LAKRRRAQEEYRDTEMRALGNLELRADMDRYLRNDPLARLGFDPDRVDWFSPYGEISPFNARYGYDLSGSLMPESMRRYEAMYPGRGGTVPEDTIMMTANWPLAALAHESRHRGIDELERAGRDIKSMSYGAEEAIVERGDMPFLDETMNLPRATAAFERGERVSPPRSATVEFPNPPDGVLRYEQILQELAQEELTLRGEPPPTVRREPEPEPGGVRGFLKSIFGGD
jgi:hypothetical protein